MKKLLTIVLLAAALVVIGGGFYFLLNREGDDANTGNTATTNTTANTNSATVANESTSENDPLVLTKPASYPSDVYFPEGAVVESVNATEAGTGVGMSVVESGATVQRALRSFMTANEWKESSTVSDDTAQYESTWTRGTRSIVFNMTVIADNGQVVETLIEVLY